MSEDNNTRLGLCEACQDYGIWREYSPSEFAKLVDNGLVPTDQPLRFLALRARPPKRDAFGNEVVVISADNATIQATLRSVTSAEKRAALRRWKDDARNLSNDTLVCPSCVTNASHVDQGVFGRIAKIFRK